MNICIKCARQWMKKRVTDIERTEGREWVECACVSLGMIPRNVTISRGNYEW